MPATTQENSSVLTAQEQAVCKQIATKGEAPHNQRAQILLALNSGASQEEAGQQSGLTAAQVRYWQGRFRTRRLSIFPDAMLDNAQAEPPATEDKSTEPEVKPVTVNEHQEVKQSEWAKPTKPAISVEKEAPIEEKPEIADKPDAETKAEEKAEKKTKEAAAKAKPKKEKASKKDKKAKEKKKKKAKKDKAKTKAEKKLKKKKEKAKKAKKKKNKKSKK